MVENPRISFIVPAFNEEENLTPCVGELIATLSAAHIPYEIVIVDDGSRDETLAVAKRLAADQPGQVRACEHKVNQGIGAALATGFAEARGEFVACCPADFRMTPEGWEPFSGALGKADVVVGCRRNRSGYNLLMSFNSWLYVRLIRLLFGLSLRDVNWICLYRMKLIRQIQITQKGIPILAEILIRLRDRGATFLEVDCLMQRRQSGTSSASRLPVMWRTLRDLLKFRIAYRS